MNEQTIVRHADGFFERGQQVTRLEAFVDAAFAFAVTLLAISIDSIPGNREELTLAMLGVPAFLTSFTVIALFWWEHARWSRHYGLDDGISVLLSLVLVGTVLIYVYPLKLMFAAMFEWITGGALPAAYKVESAQDLIFMYRAYAVAFALLGLIMIGLRWNALRQRARIGLDALECLLTRRHILASSLLPILAVLSFTLTFLLDQASHPGLFAMPGMVYFGMFLQFAAFRWGHAEECRLRAELPNSRSASMA